MHLSNTVENSHEETHLDMVSTENSSYQVKQLPMNTKTDLCRMTPSSTGELETNEQQLQGVSQSQSPVHPIQKVQAFVLYGVTAADALALMIYVPLLTDFCKERLHISDSRVGAAVGIIMGSYNLANTISSPKIGDLSDQFGRRPLILFGVASSILFTSLFPFVRNFYLAVLIRLGAGFCNSNNAVSRAYISDLTIHARGIEEEAERAALFGYLGAVWALARSISSSTAGLLTGVHIRFLPSFIADNPFATPGIAASTFLILIFILAFFFLKESHPCPKKLPGWNRVVTYHSLPNETVLETEMETMDSATTTMDALPLENSEEKDSSHILMTTTHHARFISKLICLFHYGVVLVLYLSLEISRGGVGLEPRGVGIVYAYFGLIGLLFQLIWFRSCVRRWGLRRTYQLGTLLLATGSLTVLCSTWIASFYTIHHSSILFWPLLLCFVSPQGIGFMCGLPVMGTLLANASPPDIQGLCQGTAQSSGSIARTLGPMSSGFLFSWAVASQNGPFPVFLLLSCCYMICFGIACSLSESIEHAVPSSQRVE
ncbi:Tetracycline resistance protein, class G [Galdieria sulphuraria]|nr:Tetracycline resistance protein, class G [Galdieria sulphuraria]